MPEYLILILIQIPTLIIACLVTYIAWEQWQVARNKLRLDLFDRRYKVYDTTREFLAAIVRDASFSRSQFLAFNAGTSDAGFLFKGDVVDYIALIRTRASDMRANQEVYQDMPVGDECSRHVQEEKDQLSWLTEQITFISEKFAPCLSFSHIR